MAKMVNGIFKTRRKYMISDANMYAEVFEILGYMIVKKHRLYM